MDYEILVNRKNLLSQTYLPNNLKDTGSIYKDNILLEEETLQAFNKLKQDALSFGYRIDVMSGYRNYNYQKKIYDKLVKEKGLNYAFYKIAPAGGSEHQTGLALDFCVYRDNNCFIEHDIEEMAETKWVHDNCHKYGFIIRYPSGKEDITGYSYEPWHLRYVKNIANYLYQNNLTLEEYKNKLS